jgi:hypothetical protein
MENEKRTEQEIFSHRLSFVDEELNEIRNDKYMEKYPNIIKMLNEQFENEKENEK